MKITNAFLDAIAAAIVADTGGLAEVAKVHVFLVKSPFSPSEALTVAGITKANFTGADSLPVATAVAQVFTDPSTGDRILQLREPAGGWHWQATDAVNLPQTVYGWALTNNAETLLLASEVFTTPLTINTAGQGIDLAQVRFRLEPGILS